MLKHLARVEPLHPWRSFTTSQSSRYPVDEARLRCLTLLPHFGAFISLRDVSFTYEHETSTLLSNPISHSLWHLICLTPINPFLLVSASTNYPRVEVWINGMNFSEKKREKMSTCRQILKYYVYLKFIYLLLTYPKLPLL